MLQASVLLITQGFGKKFMTFYDFRSCVTELPTKSDSLFFFFLFRILSGGKTKPNGYGGFWWKDATSRQCSSSKYHQHQNKSPTCSILVSAILTRSSQSQPFQLPLHPLQALAACFPVSLRGIFCSVRGQSYWS